MAVELTKIHAVQHCKITYGGTDLGAVKGACEIKITTKEQEITTDNTGTTMIDTIITGESVEITARFAYSDIETIAQAIGGTVQGTTNKKLVVEGMAGKSYRDNAKELVVKPYRGPTNNAQDNWTFPYAYAKPNLSASYELEGQMVIEVTFVVLPDLATTPHTFGYLGYATPV